MPVFTLRYGLAVYIFFIIYFIFLLTWFALLSFLFVEIGDCSVIILFFY